MMGKKGRDRGERRRGFDDDEYSGPDTERHRQSFQRAPRVDAAPTGPAIDGIVKWFNAEKGFGSLGSPTGRATCSCTPLSWRPPVPGS